VDDQRRYRHKPLVETDVTTSRPITSILPVTPESEIVVLDKSTALASSQLSLRQLFLGGGVLLGFAVALQRLFGFMTTALAARIGGASILGEYSVALSTAGLIGGFMSTGVGTVALRYVGQFPRNTQAYRKVLRLVIIFSAVGAFASCLVLFLGSEFAARFILKNENLKSLLGLAALSSLVFILYESLTGVLISLHNFTGLLWLSIVSGTLMLMAVSVGAHYGASAMIVGYAVAIALGILFTTVKSRRALMPLPPTGLAEPVAPRTRDVVLFGNAQQINTIVLGLASWCVIVAITRYDASFQEMGYFVVGSQLRVLASQAPTLAAQLVLPTLARTTTVPEQQRVISASTFLNVALAVVPAGIALLALPWVLRLYGAAFIPAQVACSLLLATAVVQLTYIPAANALLMFSVKTSVAINIAAAVVLMLLAVVFSGRYGAAGGAAAWLCSQVFSQIAVLAALKKMDRLPSAAIKICLLGDGVIAILCLLALIRMARPNDLVLVTALQFLLVSLTVVALFKAAQARGFLPNTTRSAIDELKSAPTVFKNYLASTRTT